MSTFHVTRYTLIVIIFLHYIAPYLNILFLCGYEK